MRRDNRSLGEQNGKEMARPKEGIYASSVSSDSSVQLDQGRVIHQDLGLTLPPGLQIQTDQDEDRPATPKSSPTKNARGNGVKRQGSFVQKRRRWASSKDIVKAKNASGDSQEQSALQQGFSETASLQESNVQDRSPTAPAETNRKQTRNTGASKIPATTQGPPLPVRHPRKDNTCYPADKEDGINSPYNTNSPKNPRSEGVNALLPNDKQSIVPLAGRKSLKRRRDIEDVDDDVNLVSPKDHIRPVPDPIASSADRGSNELSHQPPDYQPLCPAPHHSVYSLKNLALHPQHPEDSFDQPVLPQASSTHPLHQKASSHRSVHLEASFDHSLPQEASFNRSRLVRSSSCPPLLSHSFSTNMTRQPGRYQARGSENIAPWPTRNVQPYLSSPAPSQSPHQSPSASSQSPYQSPLAPPQTPSRRRRLEAPSESPSRRRRTEAQSPSTHPVFLSASPVFHSQQSNDQPSIQASYQKNTFPSTPSQINPTVNAALLAQPISSMDRYNRNFVSQPTVRTLQQVNTFPTEMSLSDPPISATPFYQGVSTSDCRDQQLATQPMLRASQQLNPNLSEQSFVNSSINDTSFRPGVSNPHGYNQHFVGRLTPRASQQANIFSCAPSPVDTSTHGTPAYQAFSPVFDNQSVAPHGNPMSPPTTSNTTPRRSLSISQTGHDMAYSSNPSGSESTSPVRQAEPRMNKTSLAKLDKALRKNEQLKATVKSLKEELATKSQQAKDFQQGGYIQGLKQDIRRQNEQLAKKDEEIAHWKQSSKRFEDMVKQWRPPIASNASILANYGFDATNRAIDSMGYRPSVPSEPIRLGHRAPLFHTQQRQPESIIIIDDGDDVLEDPAPSTIRTGTAPADDPFDFSGDLFANAGTPLPPVDDDPFDFSGDLFANAGAPPPPPIDFSTYDFGPSADFDLFNQDNSADSQPAPVGPSLPDRPIPGAAPSDPSPGQATPAPTTPREAAPPPCTPQQALPQEVVPVDEAAAERERRRKEDIWLAALNANQNLPEDYRYDLTRRIQMEREIHDWGIEDVGVEDAVVGDEAENGMDRVVRGLVQGVVVDNSRTKEEEKEFVAGLEEEDAFDYIMGNGGGSGQFVPGEDFPVPNLDEFQFDME
ncbi:MAG: hypothetical protein Q9187_000969 [Circinaria calcarea]